MPCLWFRIWGLKTGESPHDLDTVFRLLVRDEYKDTLRRYGGVGGISLDVSFPLLKGCKERCGKSELGMLEECTIGY